MLTLHKTMIAIFNVIELFNLIYIFSSIIKCEKENISINRIFFYNLNVTSHLRCLLTHVCFAQDFETEELSHFDKEEIIIQSSMQNLLNSMSSYCFL